MLSLHVKLRWKRLFDPLDGTPQSLMDTETQSLYGPSTLWDTRMGSLHALTLPSHPVSLALLCPILCLSYYSSACHPALTGHRIPPPIFVYVYRNSGVRVPQQRTQQQRL
jgi:hypothetical protein